jgi:hypothetical protein
MKSTLLILFSLFIGTNSTSGQTRTCQMSTAGTDFWIGFMPNDNFKIYYDDPFTALNYCEIMVNSELGADFTLTLGNIPYGGAYHVNAGSFIKIRIPWESLLKDEFDEESKDGKAIHLTSLNNPVRVYALHFSEYSSDIAMIYPASSLGKEYYAMHYDGNNEGIVYCIQERGIPSCHYYSSISPEFLIVGTEEFTAVKVTYPDGSYPPFMVNLNKGDQCARLMLKLHSKVAVHLVSNHPIALFSGNTHTSIPNISKGSTGHLYEQIPPLQSWGQKFIAVPFKGRCQDYWRVIASQDNTKIQIGNGDPVNLNKGMPYDFTLKDWEPSMIQSDKPVLLAQFSGADVGHCGSSSSQASMVIISHVNQVTERVVFNTYDFSPYNHDWKSDLDPDNKYIFSYKNEKTDTSTCLYYINVVAKDDAAGKIILDGSPIQFQSLSSTGYSYAQVNISRGKHIIESTEQGKGFSAYAYNYWDNQTRSYGLGYNIELSIDLATINNVERGKPVRWCWGDTLSAGNDFDSYKWNTGETTSSIIPQKSGWYTVEVSRTGVCTLSDSLELLVDKPVVDLGKDGAICKGEGRVLDAGSQFDAYKWSTKEESQKITVFQPGTYNVEVRDSYGCKTRDTIKLSLDEKPKIFFGKKDTLICGSRTALLNIKTDKGSISAERLNDHFIFSSPNVEVPDYGSYRFKIMATDENSCSEDSVISIGFHKIPKVDFTVDSLSCYGYNINAGYIGDADIDLSEFTWIFRGDTIKNAIAADSVFIPLGTCKVARDLKLIVTDKGCSNDKTISNIKVIPALQMWSQDSTGCVPFIVKFLTNSEPVDYSWDFGDGSAVVHTANPSHTFNDTGFYAVCLKVKSDQGCINEVRIDSMIFAAPNPKAAFSMDNQTLSNSQHVIRFVNESTSADSYLWEFGDGTTSEEMNPSHLFPKYTDATIVLRASNEYECMDMVSKALPFKFDNIYPPNAFSPNAPNSIDREFKLTTDGVSAEGYHFVILSRWDDIVFEARNEIKGWDGNMKNGNHAPSGNYVWILEYSDILGGRHRQTGTVTLIY